ncbi:MAG TPA: hypothetical protein VNH20_04990 [Candidatus Dormibacteraeota bacterium]|nr:hypothetical protein [Candidatus Dormibacteraeota bacterium]
MSLGVAEGGLSHPKQRQIRLRETDSAHFHRLGEGGNTGAGAEVVGELTKCGSEADVIEQWRK